MLRQIWWQPFFSPGIASVVTVTTTESWSYPVWVRPTSSYTFVAQPSPVEWGHKR